MYLSVSVCVQHYRCIRQCVCVYSITGVSVSVCVCTGVSSCNTAIHNHNHVFTLSLGKNNETYMQSSSMVKVFTHGVMCRQIDPSWWTHPLSYFSFSANALTGVTKAVVCAILSVG